MILTVASLILLAAILADLDLRRRALAPAQPHSGCSPAATVSRPAPVRGRTSGRDVQFSPYPMTREEPMPFGSRSTAAQVAAGHDLRGRNAIVTGGAAGLGARDGPGAGRSRGRRDHHRALLPVAGHVTAPSL